MAVKDVKYTSEGSISSNAIADIDKDDFADEVKVGKTWF